MKKREIWIDNLKAVACILVVLGHFLQSMVKSNLLINNAFFMWFEETIYLFHVPLFFICSGYIYQQYNCVNSVKSWFANIQLKLLTLGIPYFTFSFITWILKIVFSSAVNDSPKPLGESLFLHPLSPYWFLYVLFFIFLITPTFKERNNCLIALIISLILYFLHNYYPTNSYLISRLTTYEFYFILGMTLSKFQISNLNIFNKQGKTTGTILLISFLLLSILNYLFLSSTLTNLILCLMVCMALTFIFIYLDSNNIHCRVLNYVSTYSMPIFLMHTLFAATLRSLLFKVNISLPTVHIVAGLLISFIGPIIATIIMKKSTYLYFFLYPNRFIKK